MKNEDGVKSSETNEKPKLLNSGIGVKYYPGPLTAEKIQELRAQYDKKGWSNDPESILLSFVSPCGRWYDCFDKDTSQFYRIDGEWIVNLKVTKGKE